MRDGTRAGSCNGRAADAAAWPNSNGNGNGCAAGALAATPRRDDLRFDDAARVRPATVAVLGLGYVGLPTSLALSAAGMRVLGIDVSRRRIADIRAGRADLLVADARRLARALDSPRFRLSTDVSRMQEADVVIICVPTPVADDLSPDLRFVRAACEAAVRHAQPGQTIILTSTSYVGTTRDLLVAPLTRRGFTVGEQVFVAFSPERVDPGNAKHGQGETPRVVGGETATCRARAAAVMGRISRCVHLVSSIEAAELTKLYENTFRAVNIALANEIAGISRAYGLDPVEVTTAAATKPFGFMAHYPGPGAGGHCIPCDPHYLLAGASERGAAAPLISRAMQSIDERPKEVVARAREVLERDGIAVAGARVLIVGIAYKPGVRDMRESPALKIIAELLAAGAAVEYYDPLVGEHDVDGRLAGLATNRPDPPAYDLVVVATAHAGFDYSWLARCRRVLDYTYRTAPHATRLPV